MARSLLNVSSLLRVSLVAAGAIVVSAYGANDAEACGIKKNGTVVYNGGGPWPPGATNAEKKAEAKRRFAACASRAEKIHDESPGSEVRYKQNCGGPKIKPYCGFEQIIPREVASVDDDNKTASIKRTDEGVKGFSTKRDQKVRVLKFENSR